MTNALFSLYTDHTRKIWLGSASKGESRQYRLQWDLNPDLAICFTVLYPLRQTNYIFMNETNLSLVKVADGMTDPNNTANMWKTH